MLGLKLQPPMDDMHKVCTRCGKCVSKLRDKIAAKLRQNGYGFDLGTCYGACDLCLSLALLLVGPMCASMCDQGPSKVPETPELTGGSASIPGTRVSETLVVTPGFRVPGRCQVTEHPTTELATRRLGYLDKCLITIHNRMAPEHRL